MWYLLLCLKTIWESPPKYRKHIYVIPKSTKVFQGENVCLAQEGSYYMFTLRCTMAGVYRYQNRTGRYL